MRITCAKETTERVRAELFGCMDFFPVNKRLMGHALRFLASQVAYREARRLGDKTRATSDYDVLLLRCQSLLAAVNSLALVEKRHAWITTELRTQVYIVLPPSYVNPSRVWVP
jgi:hypothetical protein